MRKTQRRSSGGSAVESARCISAAGLNPDFARRVGLMKVNAPMTVEASIVDCLLGTTPRSGSIAQ